MLIITIESGEVSEILNDGGEDTDRAVVVNYDVDEIEPEHLHDMPCYGGGSERAIVEGWKVRNFTYNPAFVAKIREILG